MEFFVSLLFGHLIGDYFLQNDWMALNKGKSSFHCAAHVTLYTLAIAFFTSFNWQWLAFVWTTHFVVDRFALADKYLQFTRGASLTKFFYNGAKNVPLKVKNPTDNFKSERFVSEDEFFNYRMLRGGFTALVYVMVDNTIHLMSMYYMFPYLNS